MYRRIKVLRLIRAAAAACSLLLVATGGAAAAAPEHGSRATEFTFTEAANVPAEQLRKLSDPVPLSAYRPAHARTVQPPAPPARRQSAGALDLRTECAQQEAAAKTVQGWIKSRFESCQKRPYDLVIRDKNGTETIGRLWFDQWILGFAYDGSRRVDYVSSIENIHVQTVGDEDATKWTIGQSYRTAVHTDTSDPNPQVTDPATIKREELLGVWDTTPHWYLTYTSPDNGPQHSTGNQQRVAAMIHLDLFVDSPNATSHSEVDAYRSRIRFDYAGPVAGKHKGTVFSDARVKLVMSRKDPAVNESALHIYDAIKRPSRTFPSFLGKLIPGEKKPLHRLVDPEKQRKNREKSIKMCNSIWGDYSGTRLECDEYPFASTQEGSTKGDNKYSVRLIEGTDNGAGGNMLNSMFTLNRVLDGDPFYVKITS